MHPQLNWIERLATDQEVWGSNPYGCTTLLFSFANGNTEWQINQDDENGLGFVFSSYDLEDIELQDYGDSRLLIGCDKDNGGLNNYFNGRIDEVRISNVVRYNTTFMPQEYFVNDENTIGLWHLNQNLYDSSIYQNNNGTMVGDPVYVEKD